MHTQQNLRQDLIRDPSSVTFARRLSYMHSHSRLMEILPSVTGIGHQIMQRPYTMHTCLSSIFSSENMLNSNHNFLIESIIIYILSFSRQESQYPLHPSQMLRRTLPPMHSCHSFCRSQCSIVVDSNRNIHHRCIPHVVMIHIISQVVFVFLGGNLQELDQTKAQRRQP